MKPVDLGDTRLLAGLPNIQSYVATFLISAYIFLTTSFFTAAFVLCMGCNPPYSHWVLGSLLFGVIFSIILIPSLFVAFSLWNVSLREGYTILRKYVSDILYGAIIGISTSVGFGIPLVLMILVGVPTHYITNRS